MGVKPDSLCGYQPICSDCGVALCWSISLREYAERQEFWDRWRCEACDPHARGKWMAENTHRSPFSGRRLQK